MQRQTQTAAYWNEAFAVEDADLEHLYNTLLEDETPLTSDEMALVIIRRRVEQEEQRLRRQTVQGVLFVPREKYQIGQTLTFPALKYASGVVVGVRPGRNPGLGQFEVIQVDFGPGQPAREFAAGLEGHALNAPALPPGADGEAPVRAPEELAAEFGRQIAPKLEARLRERGDIVRIAGRWFPRALLSDVSQGHLNLAEAVLDVSGGGPLPPEEFLHHFDVPGTTNQFLKVFSLNYALQEDPRFDEVGPAGQVQWYLRRLEPPEVQYLPRRLQVHEDAYDRSRLPADLLEVERELDDEFSPLAPPPAGEDEVVITLTFPHRRVGTLPLSARVSHLFPTAYEAPRIRFILVDGETEDKMPGWVVREGRYVFGLDEWYARYGVPAGGYVRVKKGKAPGEVVISADRRRPTRDWVRTVVPLDGRVTFGMLKALITCNYDEQMIIALDDPAAVDEAWLKAEQGELPLRKLVVDMFRELAKLTPQNAVHIKSLYSAVNVMRRCAPGPILAELTARAWFQHVGDMYWRLEVSQLPEELAA